jgi:hypothetical protein
LCTEGHKKVVDSEQILESKKRNTVKGNVVNDNKRGFWD